MQIFSVNALGMQQSGRSFVPCLKNSTPNPALTRTEQAAGCPAGPSSAPGGAPPPCIGSRTRRRTRTPRPAAPRPGPPAPPPHARTPAPGTCTATHRHQDKKNKKSVRDSPIQPEILARLKPCAPSSLCWYPSAGTCGAGARPEGGVLRSATQPVSHAALLHSCDRTPGSVQANQRLDRTQAGESLSALSRAPAC